MITTSMKPLDLMLIAFLVWGAYKGYKKGLLVELAGTVVLIICIVLGFKFFWKIDDFLKSFIGDLGGLLPFVTFITIAISIGWGLFFFSRWTKKVLSYTLFGTVDKGLGAILGFMKSAFLAATFFWVISLAEIKITKEHTEGTIVYPAIQKASLKTVGVLGYVLPYFKGMQKRIEQELNQNGLQLEGKSELE